METPIKNTKSRRLTTTAGTDRHQTIYITVEDEKRTRIKTELPSNLTQVKTRLHFQDDKQRICCEMTKNQTKIEANYRKSMLEYLNKKFAEAVSHTKPQKVDQRKAKVSTKGRQDKITERIAYTFQQFIHNAREQKALERLTEFQLGNILKNMNFVKSTLNERLVILKVYNQLFHKNIQSFFMFILHFHVINNEPYIDQSLKRSIIESIRQLFDLEGITVSYTQLDYHYEQGLKSSKNGAFKYMRCNRQSRQTLSTFYHSVSRKKK